MIRWVDAAFAFATAVFTADTAKEAFAIPFIDERRWWWRARFMNSLPCDIFGVSVLGVANETEDAREDSEAKDAFPTLSRLDVLP